MRGLIISSLTPKDSTLSLRHRCTFEQFADK
jgi:hypothetical protein